MKDKNLAISNRDRQLLSILLAAVVLFLLYTFISSPAWDRGAQLNDEKILAKQQINSMNMILAEAQQRKQEVNAKRIELKEKYSIFLYKIDEAGILHQMDLLMASSGFAINGYIQSDTLVEPISMPQIEFEPVRYPLLDIAKQLNSDLINAGTDGNDLNANEDNSSSIEQMDISLNFSNSTYEAMYRYVTALQNLNRTFIVSDISMGKAQGTTALQGQILVRVISLPKVNEEESIDLQFQPVVPKGRINPF